MELSFSPGKTSNYSFSKLKTFSDAKKFLVVGATTFFSTTTFYFGDDVFLAPRNQRFFSDEELLLG